MSKTTNSLPIYICDFLNLWSDYREIKYKKNHIDFHSVKHHNKEKDTEDFFDLFFTKYIQFVNINKKSKFIFVMKKLNEYEEVLDAIVQKHRDFDITLMIIEEKYTDTLVDKNKDDFLCQYIFYNMAKTQNCVLISNDKYRDRQTYIKFFTFDMVIRTITWNKGRNMLEKAHVTFKVNKSLLNYLIHQKCTRCTIPKHKLDKIL